MEKESAREGGHLFIFTRSNPNKKHKKLTNAKGGILKNIYTNQIKLNQKINTHYNYYNDMKNIRKNIVKCKLTLLSPMDSIGVSLIQNDYFIYQTSLNLASLLAV